MGTIPISQIIATTPSVLGAGGAGISFNGLILTNSTRPPIGAVPSFPSQASVANYFGAASPEAALAAVYFAGYSQGTKTPSALLFAQYPSAAVAGYLRGGAGLTLTQVKALTGTLTITVGGTALTSSAITLSAATSFSNAATIIQAAFTSPAFTVTYDSQAGAFVVTSTATGSAATITFATGTIAAGLLLTQATGAVLSQGAAAVTSPLAFMQALIGVSQAWTNFTTAWEPVTADCLSFAQWVSQQAYRYAFVMWDSDAAPTQTGDTTSAGYQIIQAGYGGTMPFYEPDATIAAFVLGTAASVDTAATNGRITFAFKNSSAGVTPSVTDATTAANLIANGYNYYGAYAEATTEFDFLYPGSITGKYSWMDSYQNQIWLNSQFRIQLATLLTSVNSVPYNSAGYTLIRESLKTTIFAGINFGAIRQGVSLSATQAAEVNNAAGVAIDQTLSTAGYYLLIQDASAQVRAARGTPPMTFWYMDGESVQSIDLASIMIQ